MVCPHLQLHLHTAASILFLSYLNDCITTLSEAMRWLNSTLMIPWKFLKITHALPSSPMFFISHTITLTHSNFLWNYLQIPEPTLSLHASVYLLPLVLLPASDVGLATCLSSRCPMRSKSAKRTTIWAMGKSELCIDTFSSSYLDITIQQFLSISAEGAIISFLKKKIEVMSTKAIFNFRWMC